MGDTQKIKALERKTYFVCDGFISRSPRFTYVSPLHSYRSLYLFLLSARYGPPEMCAHPSQVQLDCLVHRAPPPSSAHQQASMPITSRHRVSYPAGSIQEWPVMLPGERGSRSLSGN